MFWIAAKMEKITINVKDYVFYTTSLGVLKKSWQSPLVKVGSNQLIQGNWERANL